MDSRPTIMIVEDDDDLRELLETAAQKRSYRTVSAADGLEAMNRLESNGSPSLIILDINMPGMDGLSFCHRVREDHPAVPIIFLSARSEEYDKILALEIGGDDYLTKPFSMKELFVRVDVALRRVKLYSQNTRDDHVATDIRSAGLVLHPESWTCSCRGTELVLTVSEYRILWRLMSAPNIVVSRDDLARAAFPQDFYNTGRSVDVHIHRIRQKIKTVHREFNSIQTVFQVGYKWTE